MRPRAFVYALALGVALWLQAAPSNSLDITVTSNAECAPGNSPGACFMGHAGGAFASPDDLTLAFRFRLPEGQLILLDQYVGYEFGGLVETEAESFSLNLEGLTLIDQFGKVIGSTGRIGTITLPEGTSTTNQCGIGGDLFAFGCMNQEPDFTLVDATFKEAVLSFSLDEPLIPPPVMSIGLIVFAGVPTVLIVSEPSVASLCLSMLIASAMGALVRRKARRHFALCGWIGNRH